jgi:hypothetical protein
MLGKTTPTAAFDVPGMLAGAPDVVNVTLCATAPKSRKL